MKRYVVFLVFMLSGAILFQGFQCASREFTTAKVAIQNNDWEKGEEYLKKELDKNPGNTEARIMLAEVQQKLKKDEAAVATINKAEETAETPEMKDRIRVFKQNMWVNIYNVGLGFYRAYSSSKKEKFLDSAIAKFQLGAQLRPAMPDFQLQQARLYEIKGDEASAIKYYQNALNLMEDEINFARENNVYLEMPRNEVLAKFGDPAMTRGMSTDQGDSLITDMFQIGDDEVYMFFDENPDTKTFRVMGWRYDPPDTWLDGEKQNPTIIDVSVIAIIAQHHFDNKQLEKALEYTKMLTTVDPTNNEANRFMVQLYQELGRTEQAVEQIRDLTVKYPKNKVYFAQYGDILLTMGKYDEAIVQYKKAIEIDPTYDLALRNIASAFKNKASIIQMAQQEKKEKDDSFKMKPDEYVPYLEESAEYFRRAQKTDTFRNDIEVLAELANIYYVLDKNDELMEIANKLEALEDDIPANKKERYYLIMVKIFDNTGQSAKLKEVSNKLENL